MGSPVLGLLGEEGDEIVARMKPGGDSKPEATQLVVNVWDRRPPAKSDDEILVVVEKDMRNNGRLARSTQNVMKRTR
jgi:hypothetical protein